LLAVYVDDTVDDCWFTMSCHKHFSTWRRNGLDADLRSKGREFDSQSGRSLVVATRMGQCGQVNHLGI